LLQGFDVNRGLEVSRMRITRQNSESDRKRPY
jgi:hypothetical protein